MRWRPAVADSAGGRSAGPALAARMANIQPFHVMRLLARARELERQGRSIVHMEIGEPDFPTPAAVIRAARQALDAGATHYTAASGLPELRQAISDHYAQRFGVRVDPGRILVTPGASGALQLVMGALIDRGDEVLLADPGYPCNRHFVRLAGGTPVAIAVNGTTRYQLSASLVEANWSPHARAVMVATPSNPTGTTIEPGEMEAIGRTVTQRRGALIVDEIYQGLIYAGEPSTALAYRDDAFVINSFSKYFGMTGWRLGWVVAPAGYVDALERLAQNIFLCAPTLSQHAGLAAFSAEARGELEARRQELRRRRDLLTAGLRGLGVRFDCEPEGAFYLYGDCSALADDSFALARDLLEHAGVAVTPGLDFGDNAPERHLRFAYTTSLSRLEEGVERIRRFLHGEGR
jgi:aspartate/methionine/tyrosine aminotransferase